MQARHLNRLQYFNEQAYTSKKFIIPFVSDIIPVNSEMRVAEVGCGEGGNLMPFLDLGCFVTGIDISERKISDAILFFSNHPSKEKITLINNDIYNLQENEGLKFNLIIMRDALEHIPDQNELLEHLKTFLSPEGIILFAFAPWRMPFGGHQQVCNSKFLSNLPFFHILPGTIFRFILKFFGESQYRIDDLMQVRDTRISIQEFLNILRKRNYTIVKQAYYFINPNYEIKFKLKARKLPLMMNIPYLRDFFVTALYTIVKQQKQ